MSIRFTAYDPDGNGIGIFYSQYISHKFAAFDNVSGTLSTDVNASEYAFIGADGGGIVFHAADGWQVDPDTGEITGTLDGISFGQQTTVDADGTFYQSIELNISDLDISDPTTLDTLFDMASDGDFPYLYSILNYDSYVVTGSASKDSLYGSDLGDVIHGGDGDDRIYGNGSISDRLVGGNGDDRVIGGRGDDVIYGQNGDDYLRGKNGRDVIKGGDGNDYITGDGSYDTLYGGAGDDTISGGRYDDLLYGGTGNDTLNGGSSPDTFVFEKSAGDDVLRYFAPGKQGKDLIIFQDVGLHSFADVIDHAEAVSGGVMITYDEGSLLLEGVQLSQLDSHDFLFT